MPWKNLKFVVWMSNCKSSMKLSLNLIQIETIFCFVSLCNDAFKQKSKSSKYTTCNKVFFRTRRFALQTHYQCVTLQMLFDKCLYLTWTWVLHLRINSFNFIVHTHERIIDFFAFTIQDKVTTWSFFFKLIECIHYIFCVSARTC